MSGIDSAGRRVLPPFSGPQGLPAAACGAYLVLSHIIDVLGWPVACQVATCALCSLGAWRAERYYERRFGRFEKMPRETARLIFCAVLAAASVAAWFALHQNWIGWFGAAWFLTGYWGTSGRRWYYLPPALLFVAFAASPGQPYRNDLAWLFGASVILTAVADHMQLARACPSPRPC